MKLYHISTKKYTEPVDFVPRIPELSLDDEDSRHPRICFSDSICGCISALPEPPSKGDTVTLFTFEVDEDDPALVPYTKLMEHDAVWDSYFTHEYWYTKPVTLTPCQIVIDNLVCKYVWPLRNCQKEEIMSAFLEIPESEYVEDMGAFMDAFDKQDINYFFSEGVQNLLSVETLRQICFNSFLKKFSFKAQMFPMVDYSYADEDKTAAAA